MRSLRTLTVALAALFATCGAAASPASADIFATEFYPATLTSHNNSLNFNTTAGTVTCLNGTYVGTVSNDTSSISLTPSYSGCTAFGFPATVDVNGCTWKLNVGAATSGDADLVCPEKKSITVTAISVGTTKCTVHVGPQTDINGFVTYTNLGSGSTREVRASLSLSGIDYSHTKGTGLGACTAGSSTTGSLSGEIVLTAELDGGSAHVALFME